MVEAIAPGGIGPGGGYSCDFQASLGSDVLMRMGKEQAIRGQALDLATLQSEHFDVDPIGLYTLKVAQAQFMDKVTGQVRNELTLISDDFGGEPLGVWTDAGEHGTGTKEEYTRLITWANELATTNGEATLTWVNPGEKRPDGKPEHRVFVLRKEESGKVNGAMYSLSGSSETLTSFAKTLGFSANESLVKQRLLQKEDTGSITHQDVYRAYQLVLTPQERQEQSQFLERFRKEAEDVPDDIRWAKIRHRQEIYEHQLSQYEGEISEALGIIAQGFSALPQYLDKNLDNHQESAEILPYDLVRELPQSQKLPSRENTNLSIEFNDQKVPEFPLEQKDKGELVVVQSKQEESVVPEETRSIFPQELNTSKTEDLQDDAASEITAIFVYSLLLLARDTGREDESSKVIYLPLFAPTDTLMEEYSLKSDSLADRTSFEQREENTHESKLSHSDVFVIFEDLLLSPQEDEGVEISASVLSIFDEVFTDEISEEEKKGAQIILTDENIQKFQIMYEKLQEKSFVLPEENGREDTDAKGTILHTSHDEISKLFDIAKSTDIPEPERLLALVLLYEKMQATIPDVDSKDKEDEKTVFPPQKKLLDQLDTMYTFFRTEMNAYLEKADQAITADLDITLSDFLKGVTLAFELSEGEKLDEPRFPEEKVLLKYVVAISLLRILSETSGKNFGMIDGKRAKSDPHYIDHVLSYLLILVEMPKDSRERILNLLELNPLHHASIGNFPLFWKQSEETFSGIVFENSIWLLRQRLLHGYSPTAYSFPSHMILFDYFRDVYQRFHGRSVNLYE
ncbi:hypothetical protein HYW55_06220 [Candidatus Gottesmanbacteria bacterium]|nr:hypothetical protein [Candidatus Gottesmanbacteria bacterium]